MKNTFTAILVCSLAGLFAQSALAQTAAPKHYCGTEVPDEAWENEFQRLISARKDGAQGNKAQSSVYTIPVIIHVVHGPQHPVGTYPNLSQAQLNSQILALNNDFAGSGYNSGNYPVTAFSNWAAAQNISGLSLDNNGSVRIADCMVQFCLATMDTLGNVLPEPGIDRINYAAKGWANPAGISSYNNFKTFIDNTVKPATIWNVSRYLNIWVTDSDINNVNLLGYATFPPLANLNGLGNVFGTSTTDGFWCYAKAFGSATTFTPNVYYNGYNRGRTCTHEIGHWLGLRHIWGDGNCSNATDMCADTPPGSASNFGAPTYPHKPNVCAGNSPDGEMFMNFMDYTNDPAKYMFTADQATRVQTAMANSPYRKFLGTHNLCSVSTVSASAAFNNIVSICTGLPTKLINTSQGFPSPSYTWSSPGATFLPSNAVTSPSIVFSTPGTHVITLTADNGTLSTTSKTITVNSPQMNLFANPQTVCTGGSTTLTASGVSTFTWEPGWIVGYEIVESPSQAQTIYTVTGTEVNGCQTTATISVFVSVCTGINAMAAEPLMFKLYPSPARDWLYLNSGSGATSDIAVEITDALGRTVLSSQLSFTKHAREQKLNISNLDHGVYLVQLSSQGGQKQTVKFIKE